MAQLALCNQAMQLESGGPATHPRGLQRASCHRSSGKLSGHRAEPPDAAGLADGVRERWESRRRDPGSLNPRDGLP